MVANLAVAKSCDTIVFDMEDTKMCHPEIPAIYEFDFPTPEEIERAKKAGLIIEDNDTPDFSALFALLDSAKQ